MAAACCRSRVAKARSAVSARACISASFACSTSGKRPMPGSAASGSAGKVRAYSLRPCPSPSRAAYLPRPARPARAPSLSAAESQRLDRWSMSLTSRRNEPGAACAAPGSAAFRPKEIRDWRRSRGNAGRAAACCCLCGDHFLLGRSHSEKDEGRGLAMIKSPQAARAEALSFRPCGASSQRTSARP